MNNKYKATINIDRELWDKFRAKCDGLDTTASEEVRRFISLFVLEEETKEFDTYEYDEFPNSLKKTYDSLEGKLSLSFDQRFERIDKKLEAMEKIFNLKDVRDDQFDFVGYQQLDGRETDEETDTKTEIKSKVETNLAELGESPYKKYYTNTEVAQIERLTQTAVSRYWTGARNPKDVTFWDRWTKDKHDQGWIKAIEEES